MPVEFKKDWPLHQDAFRLLLQWLDEGVDSGGERYLEIRRRLVAYFTRKNCLTCDDLADETLTRVARRIAEEGGIADATPARYCYIVARFVSLEYRRRGEYRSVSLDEVPDTGTVASAHPDEALEYRGRRMDCLEHCLENLSPDHRDLIVDYYCGERREKIEHRRELAARLGLTMNAVAIRACRIRDRLEACVRNCSAREV